MGAETKVDERMRLCRYPVFKDLAWLWGVNPIADMHWSKELGWDFIAALAEADLQSLRESLSSCEGGFVGVVIDDSSAVDNVQYLAIGVCWVEKGSRKEAFLCLRHLERATGEAIARVVVQELESVMPDGWDVQKLISVGCD